MPLTVDELISLKLLTLLQDRRGSMTQEETLLIDSGIIRLDPHIKRLLGQGYIRHDTECGLYCLTEAGQTELVRLQTTQASESP